MRQEITDISDLKRVLAFTWELGPITKRFSFFLIDLGTHERTGEPICHLDATINGELDAALSGVHYVLISEDNSHLSPVGREGRRLFVVGPRVPITQPGE